MTTTARWSVCATVKAPADDVLRFVAYYLDAGADCIWVFLDNPNPDAYAALEHHPKCRVVTCDIDYWQRIFGRRPKKHQVRQTQNATRTLARAGAVDWLLHADVDEFLEAPHSIATMLGDIPHNAVTARVRPMELLSAETFNGGKMAFKDFVPAGPNRDTIVQQLYPQYGAVVKGGFLSHLAGKVFVRTDHPHMELRIHNAFLDGVKNPHEVTLNDMSLAHLHAPDWASWQAHFDYRLEKGAYRADLAPAQPREKGGVTLHEVLSGIVAQSGMTGLRQFFDEVCADTPALRERLEARGLLKIHDLQLDAKLHHHFPDHDPLAATV